MLAKYCVLQAGAECASSRTINQIPPQNAKFAKNKSHAAPTDTDLLKGTAHASLALHINPIRGISVKKQLNLSGDNIVVCGMSLGLSDTMAVENQLETERVPVDRFCQFYDV